MSFLPAGRRWGLYDLVQGREVVVWDNIFGNNFPSLTYIFTINMSAVLRKDCGKERAEGGSLGKRLKNPWER
jgi:hypothetical protein